MPTFQRTLQFNEAIASGLKELGIRHVLDSESLAVERTSMYQTLSGADEDTIYKYAKDLIGLMVPEGCRVMWCGRSDDYLWVEVYQPS